MCEYCGFIALDERDLHNHQIICKKKKVRTSQDSKNI